MRPTSSFGGRTSARQRSHLSPRARAGLLSLALLACAIPARAGVSSPPPAGLGGPEINPRAFWVESNICSIVIKVPIDAAKPLQVGTPFDQLASLPAICTGNVSGQAPVPGGVRSLLATGYRVVAVSHQVTALPGSTLDSRSEVLITALFSLERPQAQWPSTR